MYCPSCHQKNTRKSKFCSNCGADLTRPAPQKTQKQNKNARGGIPVQYVFALVAGALLLGVLLANLVESDSTPAVQAPVAGNLNINSAAVLEIARGFNCPCGQCEHSLDECECEHPNGAVEIKTFIVQKLLENHHKPHIVSMVQETYGGQKPSSLLPPDAFVKPENAANFNND